MAHGTDLDTSGRGGAAGCGGAEARREMPDGGARVVHADRVLPGDAAPIIDGAVVVDGDGLVLEVGAAADLVPRHAGAPVTRIRGVVFPGLVNAHTHVELSALRGKVTGGAGFVPWVEKFMGLRAGERPDEDEGAIEAGACELARAGVAAVGDVSNTLAAVRALARHGIGGIVFHELLGLDREGALARVDRARAAAEDAAADFAETDLVYAPAPHTLYTTHPDAVRSILAFARERGVRSSIHLAEHPAERMFLADGSGPFAELARRKGFPVDSFPVPRSRPVAFATSLGALAPDVLAVHLTDADADDLARIAVSGAPVVVCPRSNLFIEVRLPAVSEMLAQGIIPALGTDSLASNWSLDPLAEARALHERFPRIPTSVLFEMATRAGARALDRDDLGRLAKGARPGILACEGPVPSGVDPFRWLFARSYDERRWIVGRGPRAAARSGPVAMAAPIVSSPRSAS